MVIEQRPDSWGYEGETCVWLDVTRRAERDGASRFALYETYLCARRVGRSEEPYNSELCIEEVAEPLLRFDHTASLAVLKCRCRARKRRFVLLRRKRCACRPWFPLLST